MASWPVFALLAALGFASINISYKIAFSKYKIDFNFALFMSGLVGLVTVGIIYFSTGISRLPLNLLITNLSIGIFTMFAIIFFFKAIVLDDASVVGPLFNLTGIFIAILAAIFLGESFGLEKYAGVALLVLGAMMLSKDNGSSKFKLSKAFWLMMIGTLSYAIGSVLIKYVLNFTDYWTAFAYARIGLFLGVLPIAVVNRKKLHTKKLGAVGLVTFSEALGLAAGLFFTIALALGPATLVSALVLVSPFFTLLLVVLFSMLWPKILKEKVTSKILFQKFVAIGLIFIGAFLVI